MAKRLLVVDDALIIREMIKDAAGLADWEIVGEAENGQDAIRLYESHRPDLVTLDLVMPEYDGIYALEGIMASDPHARVLVISAIDQRGILDEALGKGACDFIVKPFNNDRLIKAFETFGGRRSATAT